MPGAPKTSRKILAHLAGCGAYIVTALAGMLAYVFFFKATGPKVDGMTGGAIVIFLPMALLAFGLVIWTPVWTVLKLKWGQVAPRRAAAIAAILSFLATIFICQGGYRCFKTGGSEHMVGWFFILFAATGAAVHSDLYLRLTKR